MNEKQNITQLPKDWKWVKLGEVCEKMSNGANAKQSDDKIGFPISRIETIWNETIDLGRVKYIYESDAAFVEKYSLKKDDILFSHINSDIHLGKTAIFKNQTKTLIHGINFLLIRLNKNALADFFNYQFRYKRRRGEFISIAQKSVNQSSINQPKLKNIDFVLPPTPIQKAIVSKIEELFSELDKGIENLRTAQQQLKTYRQSVLKWAFEGKLTNENVKEGELPNGWKNVSITELADENKHALKAGPFGSSLKKEFYVAKGYKIYGQEQVISGDAFYGDYYVNEEKYRELSSCKIKPFDILISLVGTVGKVLLLPENCEAGIINPRLIKISLDRKVYSPKFFKYYFESSFVKSFYGAETRGTTMDVLNLGIIKTIPFPLCPIKEQNKIIQEIESRLSVADKMEESINQNLQQAEALRQSILKKAFEGKLI